MLSLKNPFDHQYIFFSWFQCKLYMSTCYNILHALMSSLSLTYTHIKRMSTFVLSVGLIIESNGFRCFSTVKTFSKKHFYISLYFSFYFLKLRNMVFYCIASLCYRIYSLFIFISGVNSCKHGKIKCLKFPYNRNFVFGKYTWRGCR